MELKCDGVFEGGGVKGIGLVGAVSAMQKAGYAFENLVGTSAGAIVASLLAVGYSAEEIEKELQALDYNNFKDETFLDKFGLPGEFLCLVKEFGIYKGDFFEKWLEKLLEAKGKTKFGDIRTDNSSTADCIYKFQCVASDITDKRMLVLPTDLREFGLDPDQFSISRAVRMSMSIPMFFEPYLLTDNLGMVHYIVDGGVLSNYPVWLLDNGTKNLERPVFGFKLVDSNSSNSVKSGSNDIHNVTGYLAHLIGTMLDAHDNYYTSALSGDYQRTVSISNSIIIDGIEKKIGTTDFGISTEESRALYENGVQAAEIFLETWDFNAWKKQYRGEEK